jgi:hypothetical protein
VAHTSSVIDLSGVHAKIDRGYEHLDALDEEIQTWLRRHPYGLRTQVQDKGRRHVGFLEIYGQPDSTRLGLLIGDCAHNFRSALDHLIGTIGRANLAPARFEEVEGKLEFPICTSEAAWKIALSQGKLEGMGRRVCAKVKRTQPYRTDDPATDDLTVLGWLDNRDKHRLVHAVAAYPRVTALNLDALNGPPRLVEAAPGPFEDGAQVYTVLTDQPNPSMQVSCDVGVEIQVRNAPRPEEVKMLLTKIGGRVQGIVADVAKAHSSERPGHRASSD